MGNEAAAKLSHSARMGGKHHSLGWAGLGWVVWTCSMSPASLQDAALWPGVSIVLNSVQHVGKHAVCFKTFCL